MSLKEERWGMLGIANTHAGDGVPIIANILAVLIGVALAGQLDTWIAGNTRLPYAVRLDRYLPASFGRIHPRWGTPYVSLLLQAVVAKC